MLHRFGEHELRTPDPDHRLKIATEFGPVSVMSANGKLAEIVQPRGCAEQRRHRRRLRRDLCEQRIEGRHIFRVLQSCFFCEQFPGHPDVKVEVRKSGPHAGIVRVALCEDILRLIEPVKHAANFS